MKLNLVEATTAETTLHLAFRLESEDGTALDSEDAKQTLRAIVKTISVDRKLLSEFNALADTLLPSAAPAATEAIPEAASSGGAPEAGHPDDETGGDASGT